MPETTQCHICASQKKENIGVIDGIYPIMRCLGCGVQFLFPAPEDSVLEKIYADYYKVWGIYNSEAELSRMKQMTAVGYLKLLQKFTRGGKLLDIGCATGEMMRAAQNRGFDVYGVEISPFGIKRCREMFGEHKIIGHSLQKNDFQESFFDVIVLSDLLEHIREPQEFIAMVTRLLKPGGIVMVVTPDTSSWVYAITRQRWPHYKAEHLCYYNCFNIRKLFSPAFDVVMLKPAFKILTLQYSAGVMNAYSSSKVIKLFSFLLKCIPQFLRFLPFRAGIGEMFILFRKKSLKLRSIL